MSSPSKNDTDNLNKVMAAVGPQIFSFLPIGSLLNGSRSPMLVNTIFHDSIFQCLGQTKTLSLSHCPHLRKVNDEQLINLIQKIVEISNEASQSAMRPRRWRHNRCSSRSAMAESSSCSLSMFKVTYLDLSRCRFLVGEGIQFCLKHTPNIEQLLLSSAARFDATRNFAPEPGTDVTTMNFCNKLEYMDLSACLRMDRIALKYFLAEIMPTTLRHLDLSGASASMNDEIFVPLSFCSNNLESLSLAGAKKITTFGVGLCAYLCRDTLKCLNLHGCEMVNLPKLLMSISHGIMFSIQANIHNNHRAILPPNFVGDMETISTTLFYSALCKTMAEMLNTQDHIERLIGTSQRYFQGYKRLEQKFSRKWQWGERSEQPIFGKLEQLDIGLIGNSRVKLGGCLATIAWLNGGRLRQVNLSGLDSVSSSDLAVLACISRDRLISLSASSSVPISPSDHSHSSSSFFYSIKSSITELDLSNCSLFDGQAGIVVVALTNLRSLKIDFTKISSHTLQAVLAQSKGLLRLSVRGCPNLTSSSIQGEGRELGLIDLDCRDIDYNIPLSILREVCPHLLRLNNRCTTLGATMLRAHRTNFLWRVGAEQSKCNESKKRKRSGDCGVTASVSSDDRAANSSENPSFINCCSILRTGFSPAKDTEQELFTCVTCSIGSSRFVCLNCAKNCHEAEGHEVFSIGVGLGYCDCCIFYPCQCLDREFDENEPHDIEIDMPGLPELLDAPFDPSVLG